MSEHYEVTLNQSPMTSSSTVLSPMAPENGFSQQMDALQIYAYGMYPFIFRLTLASFHLSNTRSALQNAFNNGSRIK